MADQQLRCGLYIPRGIEAERWTHSLAAIAETEQWRVMSLVRRWDDLAELLCGRLVQIGIVPSWDHLPPDRIPRLVAADEYEPPKLLPSQRRPTINWQPSRGGIAVPPPSEPE